MSLNFVSIGCYRRQTPNRVLHSLLGLVKFSKCDDTLSDFVNGIANVVCITVLFLWLINEFEYHDVIMVVCSEVQVSSPCN